ncbi:MAG: hypothetical protein QNK37_11280 [Acidobacteriota bacterium]|nr:hypothetical protein [Acidobacteriota bacterium]
MADTKPQEPMTEEEVLEETNRDELRPSDEPPASAVTEEGDEGEEDALGAWVRNKKIVSLWSINQNRNSWVGVGGVGWRKLDNSTDSGVTALTILGANARQTKGSVNYNETKKKINMMYVW